MSMGGRLLGAGFGVARRQAWAFVPLFVAAVLGHLLGLMPSLTLAARFVRAGRMKGITDPMGAYVVGFLADFDNAAPWVSWAAGSLIAVAGAWLLTVVLQAGVLRLLAAQAGTHDEASDEAVAEGILRVPANWLVTAALTELLKFMLAGCALGAMLAASSTFSAQPGVISALMMTFATIALIALPFLFAALELGFARSVILEETPSVAIAEGLVLFARRALDFIPAWYLLKLSVVVVTMIGGFATLIVGSMPGDHNLWILRLGPSAMVTLLMLAATTAISFVQLGVNASLVAEDAGHVPEPPIVAEPVLAAVAFVPAEPILVAQELSPEPSSAEAPPPKDDGGAGS